MPARAIGADLIPGQLPPVAISEAIPALVILDAVLDLHGCLHLDGLLDPDWPVRLHHLVSWFLHNALNVVHNWVVNKILNMLLPRHVHKLLNVDVVVALVLNDLQYVDHTSFCVNGTVTSMTISTRW